MSTMSDELAVRCDRCASIGNDNMGTLKRCGPDEAVFTCPACGPRTFRNVRFGERGGTVTAPASGSGASIALSLALAPARYGEADEELLQEAEARVRRDTGGRTSLDAVAAELGVDLGAAPAVQGGEHQ